MTDEHLDRLVELAVTNPADWRDGDDALFMAAAKQAVPVLVWLLAEARWRAEQFHADGRVTPCTIRNLTRSEAVTLYREALTRELVHFDRMDACRIGPYGNPVTVATVRAELRGKDLACWCPLDQPCHADVLLEIANGVREEA